MASHPGPGQNMVLAAINNIQTNLQCLHHGSPGASHIMRCPASVLTIGEHQGVVMTTTGEGLTQLELRLPITNLFADDLTVDRPFIIFRREAPGSMAC